MRAVASEDGTLTFAMAAAAIASSMDGSRPACSIRLEISPDTRGSGALSHRSTLARLRVAPQSFFTVVTGLLASRPGNTQGDSVRVSLKASISALAAAPSGALWVFRCLVCYDGLIQKPGSASNCGH